LVAAGIAGLGVLLRSYKYHAREELGPLLGGWLADVVTNTPWLEHVEAIVSVPTHWTHRLTRPLYAADAIAAVAARQTGLPHVPILRRVRGGKHQIGLTYTERVANVRGVFAIRRRVTLHSARLLLIDDVKTTGATLNECARVLREGGAEVVYAAVIVTAGLGGPRNKVLPSI
jgi:ComF family protein